MGKRESLLEFQFENTIVIPDPFPLALMLEDPERKKLYEMYRGEAESILFRGTFDRLAEDIYFSFYNRNVELRDPDFIMLRFLPNHQVMEALLKEESHKNLREGPSGTIYKKSASFLALLLFLEEVLKKLREGQGREEEQKRNALEDEIQALQEKSETGRSSDEALEKEQEKLRQKLLDELKDAKERDEQAVRGAIEETEKQITETDETLDRIIGGPLRGFGPGELQKLPIHTRIELAKKLRGAEKLKEIIRYLGNFRIIAASKQVEKRTGPPMEPTDVKKGSDLDNTIPDEFVRLNGNEMTRADFLKRFATEDLHEFDLQPITQKESLGRGSIIACVDTSGSMMGVKEIKAKALALAIADVAYHEKRNFACVLFSSRSEVETIRLPAADTVEALVGKVIDLASRFYGGGTDFESPLNEALRIIEEDQFNDADIVFVTDGYADVGQGFLTTYEELKAKKRFHVVGLLCDSSDSDRDNGLSILNKFCDEVKVNSAIEKDLSFDAADDWADDLFLKL